MENNAPSEGTEASAPPAAVLDELDDALADLGVACDRTDADTFTDVLREAIDEPAIGTILPYDGVSFDGVAIETEPTPDDLRTARTGVTAVRFAVAAYGTLALPSTPVGEELVSLYPDRHVAVVAASDVVADLSAGFERLEAGFEAGEDSVVFATGRSATADMGELVYGVHGPGEVHVIVLTDR